MSTRNRRYFLQQAVVVGVAGSGWLERLATCHAQPAKNRKMTICLVGGAIGVSASQVEAIALAQRHGFESVEAYGGYLASLSVEQLNDLLADMKAKGMVFGAAGLPVEFRQDEARFQESMKGLPKIAAGLNRAGVDRVGTWITPGHDRLTYLEHFKQHVRRLREVAGVLKDHGQRLGLEYVGTKSSRVNRRFPFVHTMAETKELIAEIGTGNVGFVLDSWHWWQAGDTTEDILSLKNEQVVAADLNDAPAGLASDQQKDGQRELPMATGVIDVAGFLNALNKIGYDGPVRAEPFNRALNALDNAQACAATITALKKAFALIQ